MLVRLYTSLVFAMGLHRIVRTREAKMTSNHLEENPVRVESPDVRTNKINALTAQSPEPGYGSRSCVSAVSAPFKKLMGASLASGLSLTMN